MNLNESELEERLRTLRPITPPPALEKCIARELKLRETALAGRVPTAAVLTRPPSRTFPRWLRSLGWAGAGASAAVVAIVALERTREQPGTLPVAVKESVTAFDLAESSAEILTAQDEGYVDAGDEGPARRVRFSSIERHVWRDASTGARMEIEIPREDIRLMPVAMQ